MKNITILFGAGAEAGEPFNLPTGTKFKRDIILGTGVKDFFESFIINSYYPLDERKLFDSRSTSVLYQTVVENKKKTDQMNIYPADEGKTKTVIENYLNYRASDKKEKSNTFYDEFRKAYQEQYYAVIENSDNIVLPDYIDNFLKIAGIYSYVDSLFNYLRNPTKYTHECRRVIKVYYSALYSILSAMYISAVKPEPEECKASYKSISKMPSTFKKVIKGVPNCESDNTLQKNYIHLLDWLYEQIVDKIGSEKELYYQIISQQKSSSKAKMHFITTNYTKFAQKIIHLEDDEIAYLHGRLDYFEELTTKKVAPIDELNPENTIFPYLLVQSGVKPIISPYQIKQFSRAIDFIDESEHLFILGYGINPDDEHITNIIRERLSKRKKILIHYFIYDDKSKPHSVEETIKYVKEQLNHSDKIRFYLTTEFESVLRAVCSRNTDILPEYEIKIP